MLCIQRNAVFFLADSTIHALSEQNRILVEAVKAITDRLDNTVHPTPRQHLSFTPPAAYPDQPGHLARYSSAPTFQPQMQVSAPPALQLMVPSSQCAACAAQFQGPPPVVPVSGPAELNGLQYVTHGLEYVRLQASHQQQPHEPLAGCQTWLSLANAAW